MNELYLLKKQLEELYRKIPAYERDNNIETPESIAYQEFLKEFIAFGQKTFEDESLGLEQIEEKIRDYSIATIKELLTRQPQDILDSFSEMDDITRDSLNRLDMCLSYKREDPKFFYEDKNCASDREYLAGFDEEDIARYESLEDYIRNAPKDVIVGKK